MNNTSASTPLPVEPHPRWPAVLSPLIGFDSTTGEQQTREIPFLDEKHFYYSQTQSTPSPTYLPPYSAFADASEEAYSNFLKDYPRMCIHAYLPCKAHTPPEYLKTTIVDALRESEYTRLKRTGETYVDYTGGGLYPEKLPKEHLEFLNANVLGNTHSVNYR